MSKFLMAVMLCLLGWSAGYADTTWVSASSISGTWSAAGSPYVIRNSFEIRERDTLNILPGVQVYFSGLYRMTVRGTLDVEGAAGEEVVFTTDTTLNRYGWGGLWILSPQNPVVLRHAIIENGRALSVGDNGVAGGMLIDHADVRMYSCRVRWCIAGSAHAILCRNASTLLLDSCVLRNNGVLSGAGGAVSCRSGSQLTMQHTSILENWALYGGGVMLEGANAQIDHCYISKNIAGVSGGGIYASDAYLNMTGTTMLSNQSVGGGAVDGRMGVNLTMFRCVLAANTSQRMGADGPGGAVAVLSGDQSFVNCTFVGNTAARGGAIYCGGGAEIENCIFLNQPNGGAIYFASPGSDARYSCFALNADGDCIGPTPPYVIAQVDRRNVNGDSCDAYFNLFTDPLFDDSTGAGYHLMAASPCIDAGDPRTATDPDGSVADIGAFSYEPMVDAGERPAAAPADPGIHAYPNPFNAVTTLEFDVPRAGAASLRIFDLLGREAAVLWEGSLPAGSHSLSWNAAGVPSGTYIAVLTSGQTRSMQKLLLLK